MAVIHFEEQIKSPQTIIAKEIYRKSQLFVHDFEKFLN